jgi:predicted acylesterase/phospholipase RssA
MRYLAVGPGAMGFFIYLGALSRLKLGDLEEVSGASAGALLMFLFLATKGDLQAILDYSIKIPVKQLMKPNIKNFFTNFGLVPTVKLEATIKKTCKKFLKKNDITFRELYEYNPVKLHVAAFCVDLQKTVYFSVDSHPDMSVCQAVTASVAVPFLISSVRIGEWNYIDGGTQEQIPGGPFIGKKYDEIVCLKIDSIQTHEVKDLKSYAYSIMSCLGGLRHTYNYKTITVPRDNFNIFNFSYDSEDKLRMFMLGHRKNNYCSG